MSDLLHVKLGAFEAWIARSEPFDLGYSTHRGIVERLAPYNSKNIDIFDSEDVDGNLDQAIDVFVNAVSPEDTAQAERYKRLIQTINLVDQLAKQVRRLETLKPHTHLGWFVKWEVEFDHTTWSQALLMGLRETPSLLQKLEERTREPGALTIPGLFIPSHHSYPPNHYDLCLISGSFFLTPLLKLEEDILTVKGFDLIDRGAWVVEFECEDYLLRCPREDEIRIPFVEFGITQYCNGSY